MADKPYRATGAASESLAQFALTEGIRSIQEQTADVRSIKDRIVTLIGLTATASTFLLGAALSSSTRGLRFYGPVAAGSLLFIALLYLGWRILKPIPGWRSTVGPTVIVDDFQGPSGWRDLAGFYENAFNENDKKLAPIRADMQHALIASGAMVLCFVALIWLVAS